MCDLDGAMDEFEKVKAERDRLMRSMSRIQKWVNSRSNVRDMKEAITQECEQTDCNQHESWYVRALKAERDRLRDAAKKAIVALDVLHPVMNPDEPCIVYEAWAELKEALAERRGDESD